MYECIDCGRMTDDYVRGVAASVDECERKRNESQDERRHEGDERHRKTLAKRSPLWSLICIRHSHEFILLRRRSAGRGCNVNPNLSAQADQPGCTADHGGHDGPGAPDSRGRGAAAHAARRVHGTYGTTQLGTTNPPDADTYFRIASNTKTMTAAVIVQLAQEGKLKFSDPVSKYVAGVPNGDNITIAELLDMRSGLYNYTSAPEFSASIEHDMTKSLDSGRIVGHSVRAAAQLRARYGVRIQQYQLRAARPHHREGRRSSRWPRQCRIDCSGRSACSTRHCLRATSYAIPEPYSHGYLYGSVVSRFSGHDAAIFACGPGRGPRRDPSAQRLHEFESFLCRGSRGRHLHANDLATWIQALVSGRVFDADVSAALARQPAARGPEQARRPTVRVRHQSTSLGDERHILSRRRDPGYNSFMGYDPVNKVTLIVWTNLTVSLDQKPTANTLMLKVLDQVYALSPLATTAGIRGERS